MCNTNNKIVFERRDVSWHDLVSAQGGYGSPFNSVFITRHAALNAIASICQTVCVVTSRNVLGRLVQYEQKGWDRGRWVGIYTQQVKIAWLCLGLAIKISRVIFSY